MTEREGYWIELACDRACRPGSRSVPPRVLQRLAVLLDDHFPTVRIAPVQGSACLVALSEWNDPRLDPQGLDDRLAETGVPGALELRVAVDEQGADPSRAILQILTRCQPYLDRRNASSRGDAFDAVLEAHRSIHDLSKPLVCADYVHALDTWQWTLRLAPDASTALQIAALFHDVERLWTEADARIEQHASDYAAFKRSHAQSGASLARQVLRPTPIPREVAERAADLVATHEQPGSDAERALLNDADALSFFSLNSAGFVDYYGEAHARRKVGYTLHRLSPSARERLSTVRLRADVAALVEEVRP